ncbi:uncharacterized protein LOC134286665 [Aedes albopictus]|uniref:Integrase catalytic domain-containing protein n=1 Tax=Aedes albopictus TaxID=7160 RepID=A0ABM1XMH1_AEDAL
MSNRSIDVEGSLPSHGIASSTPTKQCKVCSTADNGRYWKCLVCGNQYHPACVGIPSDNENQSFVCPPCVPHTGAQRQTYTVAPSTAPVSTVPLEYVNMSWSQISPVTAGPSAIPMYRPPGTYPYPYVMLPRNPIAPPVSCAPLSSSSQPAFSSPFPVMSNLVQALPPNLNPTEVLQVNQQASLTSSFIPPAAVAVAETSSVGPQALPSCSVPMPSLVHQPSSTAPLGPPPCNPLNTKGQGLVDNKSQSSRVASSKTSTRHKQIQLELQRLDEERKLQEKEEASKREYLQKRFELLKEIASETSSTSDIDIREDTASEKVNSWLQREAPNDRLPPSELQQNTFLLRPAPAVPANMVDLTVPQDFRSGISAKRQSAQDSSRAPARSIRFANSSVHNFDPMQRSTPRRPQMQSGFEYNLSQSHVAARQAVSRELPIFSGSPEEWPLFYSTFNSTTEICGYTQEENLLRLQKCLKGKAFEAVKCRLMHPSNVQGIITTLKMLYGNPEVIVHNLIAKISDTPSPKVDKLDSIVEFALSVQNLCATIEACELQEYSYNVVLLRELVDKLPPAIKLDWAKHRRSLAVVHLSLFADWLYDLAETVCPIASLQSTRTQKKGSAFLNVHSDEQVEPDAASTMPKSSSSLCPVCEGSCLELTKCQRFLDLTYNSRWTIIKEYGMCRKCLKRHKGVCKLQQLCGQDGCAFKHHPLLHNTHRTSGTSEKPQKSPSGTPITGETTSNERNCNAHHKSSTKTLFRVVPVVLYGRGKIVKTYAFLDDGSAFTLMDEQLAEELNLNGELEPICLRWTGDKHRLENESKKVELEISGTAGTSKKYHLREVHTVPNLGLFRQSLCMEDLVQQYHHLQGVPAESYEDVQPRLLIGSNNTHLGYPQKGREGGMFEPVATKSRLGWIVHGGADGGEFSGYHEWNAHMCCENIDNNLHRAMQEYFSLESMGISKPVHLVVSAEDQRAQTILQTMYRTESGRFVTRLLWKFEEFRLPNSKPMALQRFRCLEARMKRDPTLAEVLHSKMEDYRKQGYIRKLTPTELMQPKSRVWYLPIFPVFNANKPGKIRIVWDAAAKTQGISLNMMLLKGPDQLVSLNSVLYSFREKKVAICGDIREMFHQTLVAEEDQDCQRFLWREHSTDAEPSTYVMRVMTFGASCSPSCAQYAKNLNAKEHEQQFPEAAEVIIKKHYVDDMLASVETEAEAVELAEDIRFVHAQAGYEMRNWLSNSVPVLKALNATKTSEMNLNLASETVTEKILGMWWCTATDTFTYKLSSKHDSELLAGIRKPTKREMLRTLMAIFDPLGLISNLLIFLKVLLQEVWRAGVDWDDEIPDSLNDKWVHWLQILPQVQSVRIPRCYRVATSLGKNTVIQLHTFVDASEYGYAAVTYLRFEENGVVECAIVSAKARVAPLRFISIPRLELQAAVVGARLAETVANSLSFKIDERIYWTDSRDVLCWIRSDHRRYSQFVAFRVSELLETSTIANWRWIGSKDNIADDATKWQKHPDLESNSRWFKGPPFLWKSCEKWPEEPTNNTKTTTKEELRGHLFHHAALPVTVIDLKYFSSWERLLRTTARLFRYMDNLRKAVVKEKRKDGPLSMDELQRASGYLYRQVQQEAFSEEIGVLSGNEEHKLPKSSSLYNLSPFLDDHGILRMRGRIGKCEYAAMDTRNPVILPKDHCVTRLIVQNYHVKYHHCNHETVVNELRQVYHIPKLRVICKSIRTSCQQCINQRAAPVPPLMGDLPAARLAAFTRPFSFIGVDYFGPMYVTVGRRLEKRWGVLITCLTVRAIHLEVAHSLTADSCIMALRNFMARRGVPTRIFSDRGTNFVAASKELEAALKEMNQERVIREIVSPHTDWEFLPPASPHMGGCWERLVRSVKTSLQKMKPQRNPSDESLRNTLIEIENTVNSRPLTFVPVDDPDAPVLTPNHFLLGSSSGLKPAAPLDDSSRSLRRAWRASQAEANLFWRRWLRNYLPELTKRSKWFNKVEPISMNDVVVVVDPGLPRNCWPLGRVIAIKTSKDNQVRTATVQTSSGIYERPATKLAVLDVRRDGSVSQEPGVPGGGCYDPSVGASHNTSANVMVSCGKSKLQQLGEQCQDTSLTFVESHEQ